jgi:hypothetical protein
MVAFRSAPYVQANYATPQISQTTVAVPYLAARAAGDLNVVIVGWRDTTAQITSVTDATGNVYRLAIGPTLIGERCQTYPQLQPIPTRDCDVQCTRSLSGYSDIGV